jgi:hypothetical protein
MEFMWLWFGIQPVEIVDTHIPTSLRWSINQSTTESRRNKTLGLEIGGNWQTGAKLTESFVVIIGLITWMRAWTQEGVLHMLEGATGFQLT